MELRRRYEGVTMTREEAIQNFRNMWHWMADKSEKLKWKALKFEYFQECNFGIWKIPRNGCFLCEYAHEQFLRSRGGDDMCKYCPIDFGAARCADAEDTNYNKWHYCPTKDWKEAARLCRKIAELPEKENT